MPFGLVSTALAGRIDDVSADGGKTMAPWVRSAWVSYGKSDEPASATLATELRLELERCYPGVDFAVERRADNLIVSWAGSPTPTEAADALDVDPLLPSGAAFTAMLYGEDLPDEFAHVTIVVKHRT